MPRQSLDTRERILAAAYELFYRRGFHRTSLDDIASRARLTKRTVYHHFSSKDALAGAMLDYRHRFVLEQMAQWLGDPVVPAGAHAIVDSLFSGIAAWAERHRRGGRLSRDWTGSGFTRMAVELADLPGHPARVASRQHKRAVEDLLARRLGEAGLPQPAAAAAQIQMLIEGAVLMILIHGEIEYAQHAAAAARKLLRN